MTKADQEDHEIKAWIDNFNDIVNDRLNDKGHQQAAIQGIFYLNYEPDNDPLKDEEKWPLTPTDQEYENLTGSPAMDLDMVTMQDGQQVLDKYISAQLRLELAWKKELWWTKQPI